MSISIASQYTQRTCLWTTWKPAYASKGLPFQYDDDGVFYTIWTYDGPEVHICQIWKGVVPDSVISVYSQIQNDLDKLDFETNFKPLGNKRLGQIDADGAQVVRIKAAKLGWSFWALPIQITTSTLGGSVYSKTASGLDIPGITCKVYNEVDTEITITEDLPTCVKTVLDFEPNFNYELIGGSLAVDTVFSEDVRLWIIGAPDVPAAYGGSREFASGFNLKFLGTGNSFEIDGRVTKYVTYSPITHEGKLRIILKHPPGLSLNAQIVIHTYKL